MAVSAQAQLPEPGPASGNGIEPTVVDGSPDCRDIGLGFGFEIFGSAATTYRLTGDDGELTGGAARDAGSSLTISNSDGAFFDWTSTLAVDAVIVQAGSHANVFSYDSETTGDTGLHGPLDPDTGAPKRLRHVEWCYDYEVRVTKTVATTFTRTWNWTLEKTVSPATLNLPSGETGVSTYEVTVDRTDFVDGDWAVTGRIVIDNDTPFDTNVTRVSDVLSERLATNVDCRVTFPHELISGDTLLCNYAAALPDGSSRTSTVTVRTTGGAGPSQATAPVTFETPTTEVNASIHVEDSNDMSWGPVSDDAAWTYEGIFECDAHAGTYDNTATLVETGQSADASVTVTCGPTSPARGESDDAAAGSSGLGSRSARSAGPSDRPGTTGCASSGP